MLAEITGFDAVSLQPNAGSQGEYTGLLVIKRYQEHRGQARSRRLSHSRLPAHGTNPASAVMAGMKVDRRRLRFATATSRSTICAPRRSAQRSTGGADGHVSFHAWRL